MEVEDKIKLLKAYPPIIEVRVPEKYAYSPLFKHAMSDEMKKLWGDDKYLIVIMPIEHMPAVINIKTAEISDEALQEFAKKWSEVVQTDRPTYIVPDADNDPEFSLVKPSFIKIHSVLEDGEDLFREKMERMDEYVVNKIQSDNEKKLLN